MSTKDTKRERLAKELNDALGWDVYESQGARAHDELRRGADFILARQERREGPLVKALEDICSFGARTEFARANIALAARAMLDAEPALTLAEAVEAMFVSMPPKVGVCEYRGLDVDGTELALVRPAPLEAVRAALAREREQRPR